MDPSAIAHPARALGSLLETIVSINVLISFVVKLFPELLQSLPIAS